MHKNEKELKALFDFAKSLGLKFHQLIRPWISWSVRWFWWTSTGTQIRYNR